MLEFLRGQLAELLEKRAALESNLDEVLKVPTAEKRGLNADESAAFDAAEAALRAHDDQIGAAQAQIVKLEGAEERKAAADKLAADLGQGAAERRSPGRVTSEPAIYRKGGDHSYFLDLANAQVRGSRDAIERLVRNDREVFEKRAISTTDGAGGEFVPPLWQVEQFIKLARAGRVVADQVTHMDLPSGTDSISLPRLATGTAVAEQSTQNTAVQATDITTNSVTANVATIAGQQVVSLQLMEQSPIQSLDQILLADLAADYATKLDVFVINNNATNKVGLLNVSGINAVTYTDASPTVGELYPKVADGVQQVHTGRFLPPQKIFMHPRRWAWFESALDTAGRPLVVPMSNMPQNALATEGGEVSEGLVGTLQGLPVFVDPSIPTNLGAGTNEDRIIIARSDDVILMEGSYRSETFREPLAAQLSVLLRFYNYAALHASRYPKSISVIAGTGLVAPTF